MDEHLIYGTEALVSSASVPYIHFSHMLTLRVPRAADPLLCQACKLSDLRQTDHDFHFISVKLDMIKSVLTLGRKMEISDE